MGYDAFTHYLTSNCGSVTTLPQIQALADEYKVQIHLAIMREPYLSRILDGQKTIESRITKVKVAPFAQAREGDVVLFKESSGPIRAIAMIKKTEYHFIDNSSVLKELAKKHSKGLSYEADFIETKIGAKYLSLIWLSQLTTVQPITVIKRGQSTWLVFKPKL